MFFSHKCISPFMRVKSYARRMILYYVKSGFESSYLKVGCFHQNFIKCTRKQVNIKLGLSRAKLILC